MNQQIPDIAVSLEALLRKELLSIPFEHWGYFFPCHVAAWRFIQDVRPGVLGELQAGYKTEPYFKGKGADWFCDVLGNQEEYIGCIEAIMYPLTDQLSEKSKARGFPYKEELPPLDLDTVRALASAILNAVDGSFSSS